MAFNQTKRDRAKTRLKLLSARFQALIGSILFLGLASAVGALFFFAWLADEVLEGDAKTFDETVRVFVHGFAGESLTALMQFITMLGSTLFLSILCVSIFVIFMIKNLKRAAVLLMTTMAGAVILNFALKMSFGRLRPVPFFDTPLPDSYSFPSGHALYAACFYGVLAWLIAARIQNKSLRILIWSLAVLLALLIGLSRIYLGVHYPSDVIAGYAAAVVWILTVVLIDFTFQKWRRFFKNNQASDGRRLDSGIGKNNLN
ncbi:MAG: phosphatase PAP2 family protein [Acidobacteria bacterium]|nr:phosphatase PAP2 family protein [Acidobacteriota bacterium]MCA1638921.1 phosphatase PAP2 family protein [Acidobacteriota bacterium]